MRQSQGALAVVRRRRKGQVEFLTQWNEGWKALNLVGGHREEGESFRECVAREVSEELELAPEEFHVAEHPLAHLEYVAYSRSAGQPTAYVMELFDVKLGRGVAGRVSDGPLNAWVSEVDLRAGHAADRRAISETVARVLGEAGLVNVPQVSRR